VLEFEICDFDDFSIAKATESRTTLNDKKKPRQRGEIVQKNNALLTKTEYCRRTSREKGYFPHKTTNIDHKNQD